MIRKLYSLIILTATYLSLCFSFLVAYLHPSKSVLIKINSFNEANFEFVLLLVSFPVTLWYLYTEFREILVRPPKTL